MTTSRGYPLFDLDDNANLAIKLDNLAQAIDADINTKPVSDWNLALSNGVYFGNAANGPGGACFGLVMAQGSAITQTAFRSTTTATSFAQWQRASADGGVTWTAWQSLAAAAPAWTPITKFASGCSDGGSSGAPSAYTIEPGWVTLRGAVSKAGGFTGGDLVLKAGAVPSPQFPADFAVASQWLSTATNRLRISTDGSAVIEASTSAAWIGLDGIRYPLN